MKTRFLQCLIFIRSRSVAALLAALIWLLVGGLALEFFLLRQDDQQYKKQLSTLQEKTRNLEAAQQSVAASVIDVRSSAEQFHALLGRTDTLQEHLKQLFKLAGKQQLNLPQGNYKVTHNPAGDYESYSIELPVTGSYQKIRKLSEDILLALPFGALEEIQFKRDNSSNATLEVKLKFVLFLRPDSPQPKTPLAEKTVQEKP